MKNIFLTALLIFAMLNSKAQLFNIGAIEKRCDTTANFLGGSDMYFNADGTSFGLGYSKNPNNNQYDGILMKFDKDFNVIWQKAYGGSGSDVFGALQKIGPDKLLIFGGTTSSDGDVPYGKPNIYGSMYSGDLWLLMVDTAGNVLHGTTYGSGCSLGVNSWYIASNGNIFIGGNGCAQDNDFIANTQPFHEMGFVAMLDSQLNKKWFLPLNSPYDVNSQPCQLSYNDTFVVAYRVQSNDSALFTPNSPEPSGSLVTHFLHIDTNMQITNHYSRGCSGNEFIYNMVQHENKSYASIKQTANDGDYFPNNIPSNFYMQKYCILAELNKEGQAIWSTGVGMYTQVPFQQLEIDIRSMAVTDSFIYALGYITGNDDSIFGTRLGRENDYDMMIYCFSKGGKLLGRARIGDSTGDDAGWIRIAPDGKIYATYISQPVTNVKSRRNDCFNWSTKAGVKHLLELYHWPVSINEQIQAKAQLKVFPNPADQKLNIGFENDDGILFHIELYAMSGKKIYSKNDIYKETEIDVSNFPKGNYLLEVRRNGKKYKQKVQVK